MERHILRHGISETVGILLGTGAVCAMLLAGCAIAPAASTASAAGDTQATSAPATTAAPVMTPEATIAPTPEATPVPTPTDDPNSIGTLTVTAADGVEIYPEAGSDVEPVGHADQGATFPVYKTFVADGTWNYYEIPDGRYISVNNGDGISFTAK